jgi:methyltransferase (TIGR00027 family)
VVQYVILAAGLDTFALRRTDLRTSVQVFEVDQVDTQREKRRRLRTRTPANLSFVGVDFERQKVGDALLRSRFDPDNPAFFSWLGTTYYLTRDAIRSTLRSVRKVAAGGSELVLDYWSQSPGMNWRSHLVLTGVRAAVALQSEPMRSFFSRQEIEREVQSLGFEVLENLPPEAQRTRYLAKRRDGLDVPDFANLLHLRMP